MNFDVTTIPLRYSGSVKNVRAPLPGDADGKEAIFEYTDDFSVFDWGKLPDPIPRKGQALARLSAYLFERLADASEWKSFAASPFALPLFQDPARGSSFRALAERLSAEGLRTHFRSQVSPNAVRVESLNVTPPVMRLISGQRVPDYHLATAAIDRPRQLVPLEVVFRHGLVAASSVIARYPDAGFYPGQQFPVPFVECFTKLEETDRALSLSEALWVSRLSPAKFEETLHLTALVSTLLKFWFRERGLELVDGKLEWGTSTDGEILLADAIGPDELRVSFQDVSLSKECLREFYRRTDWYADLEKAKTLAALAGETDWQRYVKSRPPRLPAKLIEAVSSLYTGLCDRIVGDHHFGAPELDTVARRLTDARQLAEVRA